MKQLTPSAMVRRPLVSFLYRALRLTVAIAATAGLAAACSGDPAARKQKFVESGDLYLKEGKLQEAIIEYRNAVQADPRFGEARAKLAASYEQAGNGKALGEYIRAADLLPERVDLQLTTGNYLMAVGKLNDALSRADTVLEREPNNVAAHILRGNALGGLNNLDTALTEMEEAIRLEPTRGASYTQLAMVEFARGRQREAEAAFQRAVEIAPTEVGGHLAIANFYWASERLPDAERAFLASLAINPKHEGANRAMAVFALATGRPEQAEKYLKQLADGSQTPAAKFALAEYYIAARRTNEAIAILEPMKSEARTASGASNLLARAYAVAGDRSKAHAIADEILAQDPKNIQTRLLKGRLQLEDGRRDDALASVRTAVTAEPTSAAAQFALGKVYAARGDVAGAETAFREVLKQNPGATAAQVELSLLQLSSGSPSASLRTAEDAVRTQPGNLEARLALVRGLLASKNYSRAQQEIQTLLAARPNFAAVHVQSGVLAAGRNNTAAARAAFRHALELDADSLEALAGLLALDLNAKDFAAAKNRIAQRLDKGRVTPELLLLAARTYGEANDFQTAEQILRRAIETEPTMLSAYAMLAQLYLSQGKLDEARQEFDRLAQRHSKPVGALTMSGVILQVQGQLPMARERFERVVAIDSRAAVAANNLAWLYAESGEKLGEALRLAQGAAEVLPNTPEVLDTLGWVYYKSDLPALAIAPLVRCVEKAPTNADYRYHLGLAYVKSGDAVRGRESLVRALALGREARWANDARRAIAALDESGSR